MPAMATGGGTGAADVLPCHARPSTDAHRGWHGIVVATTGIDALQTRAVEIGDVVKDRRATEELSPAVQHGQSAALVAPRRATSSSSGCI